MKIELIVALLVGVALLSFALLNLADAYFGEMMNGEDKTNNNDNRYDK